ncbi:MAG: LysE family transporter [Hydrogenophaga sp.]|uniref:LysE family translocator n=1 Tax=Hydrogenophaga sp. TaxID=1904254 RepID=UPI0016A2A88E|nr:LysE family translocator [Hydrogenophaga sp.]NIM42311.1 LysE family transporter [Hydrogenophaga sp.]NIN28043.1 LysE family transporter [Hydrogenophaga sp.]NIN32821.1 LysE family transporter [Hydrogenophaga sp.]NIN54710.1 LysE family transporter [Hydrogenophaga sp.]NIO51386.1 LysE family transporter [Hydrogenophaga sp.]
MPSLEFLLTSAVVVVTPGAGVLFTVSTGLSQGRVASAYAALGCTLGILPHMAATALGLAAVMHAGALAFQLLKLAGVLYLLYLAWATWRDRSAFAADRAAPAHSPQRLMGKAILLNALNPKLTLFFFAFLPQFMDPADPAPMRQFAVLSAVFMAMTLGVFVAYGALADAFRQRVLASPRTQNGLRRGFSAAFALMAAKLATSER